ncbi:hypothetical protein JB92DRAFT_3147509 [Gautieria morchelliformis]|nr:hypothetical protein JB92DRAFT_3147509 [Gautieria morchelliformis]
MSGTSHSTALFHLKATPAACPTIAHAPWGPPLLVSNPLAVALLLNPITTTVFEQAKACSQEPSPLLANPAATTLHEGDPFLLTLTRLAKALYTHAMGEAEQMIELVRNELRMAAILVTHKYTISIPHAHASGVGPGAMKRALHLPVLKRPATSSHGPKDEAANMYPTSTSCIGRPPPHPPQPSFPSAPPHRQPSPPAPPSTSPPPSLPQSTPAICDQGQTTHIIPPVHRPLCLRVRRRAGHGALRAAMHRAILPCDRGAHTAADHDERAAEALTLCMGQRGAPADHEPFHACARMGHARAEHMKERCTRRWSGGRAWCVV